MELENKVYQNLRDQILVSLKMSRINEEVAELERERQKLSGAIEVLADLYMDQTGNDLQKEINTNPEWNVKLDQAQKEAEGMLIQSKDPSDSQPQDVSLEDKPKLRRVSSNKTPALDDGVEVVNETPSSGSTRSRKPVAIQIDDSPPGPETPDKPDPK
ncbi:MAG: hypothetical protein CMB80_01155 [Flammeovirgaceae bacterium]|nr:hypothetical protein [Flammeovirgaceae bacterium]